MAYVFRPVKSPPKLSQYTLSSEAQKTLAALEKKYDSLLTRLTSLQTPVVRHHDPANYYKNIYRASFQKSLLFPYSEKDQEERCAESSGGSSLENQLQFTSDSFQRMNSLSYIPREQKGSYQKETMFERKHSKNKVTTEVFLDYRPSDKEIAESVLSLTQRTSTLDSPKMDLDVDFMEFQQLDENVSEAHVHGDCNLGNDVITSYFSQSAGVFTRSESEENEGKPEEYYLLNQKPSIPIDYSYKSNSNKDILIARREEMILCDSIYSPVENIRNNHELPLSISETTERNNFELKLSGCELSQISHTSQLDFNGKFEDGAEKFESSNTRNQLKEDQSPFDKKHMTLRNSLSIYKNDESPFDDGNFKNESSCLMMMIEKAIKYDTEIVPVTLQNSICENESPYVIDTDLIQSNHLKSHKETSKAKYCRNEVSECKIQKRIDDFFQINSSKNEDDSKDDNIQVQKRISKHCDKPCTKKVRTSFKPPYKAQVKNLGEHLAASLCSSPVVTNISSLSLEKQKETFTLLESSHSLALTLLYNTNLTSVNTFYTASDHAKKKNSSLQPQIVGIGIIEGDSYGSCFLVPFDLICRSDVKKFLLNIMFARKISKIIANCKEFLISIQKLFSLSNEHVMLCQNLEDPVIACWLVDPESQPASFMHVCKTAKMQYKCNEESWVACFQFTPKLMQAFRQILKKDKLWSVFTQIEMKLVPVLAFMETHTIKVDTELFSKFSHILKAKIKKLKEAIYKEAGHKFSLNSHVQLRQVLYEELKLEKKLAPEVKIGKTDVHNQKSTCESSLTLLAAVHPLPALVSEYRQKVLSTYVDGMLSCVTNGNLMTHWDQTAAATGRLTSSQPNIQAVPKTVITINDFQNTYVIGSEKISKIDINVREPFISNPGYLFLAADFQQIELRVLAHLSGDSTLQTLFRNSHEEDIFMSLTKQWQNKKTTEEVTSAEREQTKRVVYSVMWPRELKWLFAKYVDINFIPSRGKDKLSEYLKVKSDIAQEIINSFLQKFSAIESFTKKCWLYAEEYGYTETVSGRRRYFPNINSSSPVLKAQARRQAVNFCVQGDKLLASPPTSLVTFYNMPGRRRWFYSLLPYQGPGNHMGLC